MLRLAAGQDSRSVPNPASSDHSLTQLGSPFHPQLLQLHRRKQTGRTRPELRQRPPQLGNLSSASFKQAIKSKNYKTFCRYSTPALLQTVFFTQEDQQLRAPTTGWTNMLVPVCGLQNKTRCISFFCVFLNYYCYFILVDY